MRCEFCGFDYPDCCRPRLRVIAEIERSERLIMAIETHRQECLDPCEAEVRLWAVLDAVKAEMDRSDRLPPA